MIRDRIIELRRVPARELLPNPKNWRSHPPAQRAALRGLLNEVGYAGALLVRETPDGLMLIDGHLRMETTPEQDVPVLVLDLNEAEADTLLATFDPLGAMATANMEALAALLDSVRVEDDALQAMFEALIPAPPILGPELDESLARGLSLCICAECGHEHGRQG